MTDKTPAEHVEWMLRNKLLVEDKLHTLGGMLRRRMKRLQDHSFSTEEHHYRLRTVLYIRARMAQLEKEGSER